MHLLIAAVCRLKTGPEYDLVTDYKKRIDQAGKQLALGPLEVKECPESRAQTMPARKDEEAKKLITLTKNASYRVTLDEHGTLATSQQLADLLRNQRDNGAKEIAFLIGGPDGHGKLATTSADKVLSLGKITLPHMLARVVLAEQLYRAITILAGHPYHRA